MRRLPFVISVLLSFAMTAANASDVKLTVEEPSGVCRTAWPVTTGIPIAQGTMTDQDAAGAALFGAGGAEMPLQTEILARWPDGSVRWLHCVGHTGGYYSDAPLPVSRTYQMGHSTNFGHVWVSGDLDYYYLTGDRRARKVALQIADAMVSHMPTSYGTHIRALGWPMILVLDAYQATGDQKYLDAATANWQVLKKEIDWDRGWVVRLAKGHCLHEERQCFGNVPFMEGLTLCALARYHRLTDDPEVLRAISVGIDQMIRECWQEDAKTFSYTACPLSSRTPYVLFVLSVEAMAYEVRLTGNKEHLRILREGLRAAIPNGSGNEFGKSLAQMIFFAPYGLTALENDVDRRTK